jgi:hypothetical protein
MDLQEMECVGHGLDRGGSGYSWRAFVKAVMNHRVPQNAGEFRE